MDNTLNAIIERFNQEKPIVAAKFLVQKQKTIFFFWKNKLNYSVNERKYYKSERIIGEWKKWLRGLK